jgi:hypothetical protein
MDEKSREIARSSARPLVKTLYITFNGDIEMIREFAHEIIFLAERLNDIEVGISRVAKALPETDMQYVNEKLKSTEEFGNDTSCTFQREAIVKLEGDNKKWKVISSSKLPSGKELYVLVCQEGVKELKVVLGSEVEVL